MRGDFALSLTSLTRDIAYDGGGREGGDSGGDSGEDCSAGVGWGGVVNSLASGRSSPGEFCE